MGAQARTDVLPYISLIPVFGYLWPGASTMEPNTANRACPVSTKQVARPGYLGFHHYSKYKTRDKRTSWSI